MLRALTFVAALCGLASVLGVAVGSSGVGPQLIPISFLGQASQEPVASSSLTDAARRWTTEHPDTGPGEPLVDHTRALLTVGDDTLRAFPTARGDVCYEVRDAGTCARLTDERPAWFSILYTRDGGRRAYGVVRDDVRSLTIQLGSRDVPANIVNGGFYATLNSTERLTSVTIELENGRVIRLGGPAS